MLADLWIVVALAGLLGLLIGSFLNVLIYRLPKMLERQWAVECAEMVGKTPEQTEVFNLMLPRSRCQQCGHHSYRLGMVRVFCGPLGSGAD